MSRFPCSTCGHRIAGKAAYLYPTVYIGDDQAGERQRLCNGCCAELLQTLRASITNDLQRGCCWTKHSGEGDPQAVAYAYATLYDPGSVRQDFGGPVCEKCLGPTAATMLVELPQRG